MQCFLCLGGCTSYYQVKCRIILAAVQEENKLEDKVAAAGHHLRAANGALEEAKRTHVYDETDVAMSASLQEYLREEWDAA